MGGRPDPRLRPIAGLGATTDRPAPKVGMGPIRFVLIDPEMAFVRVVVRRADALDWQHRVLTAPPRMDDLAAMRPGAVVIDAEACPDGPWDFVASASDAIPEVGLLVVAHQSTVSERVRALRLGADDWITKPVHPEEVVARIQAVVRRRMSLALQTDSEPLVTGELRI